MGTIVAHGLRGRRRLAGGQRGHAGTAQARTMARYFFFLLFLFFFSLFLLQSTADGRFLRQSTVNGRNRPPTAEINRRRPILAVPPDSDRSAYRSAAGPVCTGRRFVSPRRDDSRPRVARAAMSRGRPADGEGTRATRRQGRRPEINRRCRLSLSPSVGRRFVSPRRDDSRPRVARAVMSRGRPADGEGTRAARRQGRRPVCNCDLDTSYMCDIISAPSCTKFSFAGLQIGNPFLEPNIVSYTYQAPTSTASFCAVGYHYQPQLYQLPASSPFDNFLKAAGC
ncbi:hypothetical protein GW17_00003981 [Ensete ventricosum]|nr:hypothetical protein GW17_00003981 [Ensete ventricosum]